MGARDQEAGRIGSIHYRISHSAGVTLNSNPPSFLERKIFIHYAIPAEYGIHHIILAQLEIFINPLAVVNIQAKIV